MTDTNTPTRVAPDPSNSVLIGLARALLADASIADDVSWPELDLTDPQQREFGDYELLEEIGRGGMGIVYRARQRSLDRDVAIKFIAAGLADSVNVARFLGEARAAARLMHPNIVPVHEVGSIDHVHFFSMPLVQGVTLASRLASGPLPTSEVLALLLKITEAINYAHRLGLLHLDLKPANVLLDARNEPLIADFGLARHMDTGGGVDAQEVSGTPAFMAPEQILIKQYRLTPATDLYALGAILYRCLTGVSPHGNGSADELIRSAVAGRIRDPRELVPAISRDIAAVCMKCMELQPADRYASAAQLADDLRRLRDGLPVSVRRIGRLERLQRWLQREPKLAGALAIAISALLIGAAATTWQWREALAQRDLANAERDRATIASEVGAHVYAYGGNVQDSNALDRNERARNLIDWLRQRLPGDEARQADALTAFASAVGNESYPDAEQLLYRIIEVLGVDYRQDVIKALQVGTDIDRHILSAILSWNEGKGGDAFAKSLAAAVNEDPLDPFVWHVASIHCPDVDGYARCAHPQAPEMLVRIGPDNMYHWLLVAISDADPARAREALREAARRTHFDDYIGASYLAHQRAFETAAVKVPALIARPIEVLSPNQSLENAMALLEANRSFLMPNWSRLVRYCGVAIGSTAAAAADIRDDCRTVGTHMMRSETGLLSRMIGVAIVRNLAPGTPLADEALQVRRRYKYLVQSDEILTPSQRVGYSTTRFLSDIATAGEMVAMQRRLESFGIPPEPPADWQPDDLNELLSARERIDNIIAANQAGSELVAQGKYAEAVSALLAVEQPTRRYLNSVNAWHVPRHLMNLGKARTALGQFREASTNLLDAWEIVEQYPPATPETRECAAAIVALFDAWNAAEPSKAHAAKAAEWRETLAALAVADDGTRTTNL